MAVIQWYNVSVLAYDQQSFRTGSNLFIHRLAERQRFGQECVVVSKENRLCGRLPRPVPDQRDRQEGATPGSLLSCWCPPSYADAPLPLGLLMAGTAFNFIRSWPLSLLSFCVCVTSSSVSLPRYKVWWAVTASLPVPSPAPPGASGEHHLVFDPKRALLTLQPVEREAVIL